MLPGATDSAAASFLELSSVVVYQATLIAAAEAAVAEAIAEGLARKRARGGRRTGRSRRPQVA